MDLRGKNGTCKLMKYVIILCILGNTAVLHSEKPGVYRYIICRELKEPVSR